MKGKTMNKGRLLKTAEIVERVAKEKPELFSMNDWKNETECGSVCCAVGWAARDKELMEQGLSLESCGENSHNVLYHNPQTKIVGWGMQASMYFYQLSLADASYLFNPHHYERSQISDAKYVANRIRKFVEDGGRPVDS